MHAFPGCVYELGFRQDLTDCANARKQCAHDETMSNPHGCALFPETKTTRKYVHTRLVRIGPFRRHSRLSKAVPRSAISSTAHRRHFCSFCFNEAVTAVTTNGVSESHPQKRNDSEQKQRSSLQRSNVFFLFRREQACAPPTTSRTLQSHA